MVRLGVPLPPASHNRTVPGTYADWEEAEIDKIRFAFWARLGQPDLAPLMDLLKEAEFRDERDAYIAAIKVRRRTINRAREEHKKAEKERHRRSLQGSTDLNLN